MADTQQLTSQHYTAKRKVPPTGNIPGKVLCLDLEPAPTHAVC